jgi:hypothetical protein
MMVAVDPRPLRSSLRLSGVTSRFKDKERHMKTMALVISALVLAFAVSASADSPNPNDIRITNLVYAGSGCPPGSADVRIAPDGTAFRLLFDSDFIAETGPGISLTESRKNCQVNVTIHIPQGFTFAIASVDYRGSADIPSGASGLEKATYFFQGQAGQVSSTHTLNGPFHGDWHFRDQADVATLVFAPCGADVAVNINAQVRLTPGTSTDDSFMRMDSERGRLDNLFHFSWKRCE